MRKHVNSLINFLPSHLSYFLQTEIRINKSRYIRQEIDDLLAGGAGVEQPDDDELLAELGEILGAEVSLCGMYSKAISSWHRIYPV